MKRLLILLFFISSFTYGQNLVPNPSFEQYDTCPDLNACPIYDATGWSSFAISPDYLNGCASLASGCSVPYNANTNYQPAATGDAYAGFYPYAEIAGPDVREYIGRPLVSTLSIGSKYFVSIKVNLALDTLVDLLCACNKIGVVFTTIPYSSEPPPHTLTSNFAHVYTNTIVTDTVNWTSISGSFIADSAYQYIVIGNFFDDANTDTLILGNASVCRSYYFVDDVCVSTDSLYCTYPIGIEETKASPINIYPNPTTGTFTVQGIEGEIQVHDLFGRLVLYTNEKEIDMSSYPKGMYMVRVGETVRKLILH